MKNLICFFICFLFCCILSSQTNPAIKYQFKIYDEVGDTTAGPIALRILIIDTLGSDTLYMEEHSEVPLYKGLGSVKIGRGDLIFVGPGLVESLADIPWQTGNHWMQVEVKTPGDNDYSSIHHSELLIEPWASINNSDWINEADTLLYTLIPSIRIANNSTDFSASELQFFHGGQRGGTVWFESNDSTLRFSTGVSTEGINMQKSTNFVGIGTVNPETKVQIVDNKQTILSVKSTGNYGEIAGIVFERPGEASYAIGTGNDAFGGGSGWGIRASLPDGTDHTRLVIDNLGNIGIRIDHPQADLHVNGTTKTNILEITGGDVAEARHTTTGNALSPGSVVVFDEYQTGKIRLSDQPYDKKVAGVISGAGAYFAGVCLLQEELEKGAVPVAQVGTVEVLAVGPVGVGDLLTTSKITGHAMAAKNRKKQVGTIIGKAVGTLKAGEQGLVEMQIEKH